MQFRMKTIEFSTQVMPQELRYTYVAGLIVERYKQKEVIKVKLK